MLEGFIFTEIFNRGKKSKSRNRADVMSGNTQRKPGESKAENH